MKIRTRQFVQSARRGFHNRRNNVMTAQMHCRDLTQEHRTIASHKSITQEHRIRTLHKDTAQEHRTKEPHEKGTTYEHCTRTINKKHITQGHCAEIPQKGPRNRRSTRALLKATAQNNRSGAPQKGIAKRQRKGAAQGSCSRGVGRKKRTYKRCIRAPPLAQQLMR